MTTDLPDLEQGRDTTSAADIFDFWQRIQWYLEEVPTSPISFSGDNAYLAVLETELATLKAAHQRFHTYYLSRLERSYDKSTDTFRHRVNRRYCISCGDGTYEGRYSGGFWEKLFSNPTFHCTACDARLPGGSPLELYLNAIVHPLTVHLMGQLFNVMCCIETGLNQGALNVIAVPSKGLLLESGELLHLALPATLLEKQSYRQTTQLSSPNRYYTGASFRIAKGMTVRVGQSTGQRRVSESRTHTELTAGDGGYLYLTSRRLVFLGLEMQAFSHDIGRISAVRGDEAGIMILLKGTKSPLQLSLEPTAIELAGVRHPLIGFAGIFSNQFLAEQIERLALSQR